MVENYRNIQTGEILTKTENIGIETRVGNIPAAIYRRAGEGYNPVVISDEVAAHLLEVCRSKFPIDLYSILHRRLSKQLAITLTREIEAEYQAYLENLDKDI